jgi:putative tryptophan/tyrosine transport system substrate-binding protein
VKRREFILALGGAAAAWPVAVRAQKPALPVVGYLRSDSPEASPNLRVEFLKGLSETGYVEGRNVAIEYRWAHNDNDRLPELAADLVRRRVAVIATPGSIAAALAAKAVTTTIPIVYNGAADPVQAGLVASLNRPGGNITGVTNMSVELGAKRLGLLQELVPGAARFAVLVDSNNSNAESETKDVQEAAAAIGRQIEVLPTRTNRDIDTAFATLAQKRVDALIVSPGPFFTNRRVQLVTLATRHAVPAIYSIREYTEIGGLMSYGSSLTDQYRGAGIYTGRILKGEQPAEMPVDRATKFEFVINLQTAKAFGIDVPPTLLARADEVIE